MPYRIAGIDVHKRMLAVVVSDVEEDGKHGFERRQFGSNPAQLRCLAAWLLEPQVEEVVMESTAQYWKPVWGALERYWKPVCRKRRGARPMSGALHLAQAQSNRGPRGRKDDFADAERLVKRLVANELRLSFVPEAEQRLWRTVMRTRYQLRCNQVQVHNRLEALLEEAQIKLSSLLSDLLGVSGRRMLKALAVTFEMHFAYGVVWPTVLTLSHSGEGTLHFTNADARKDVHVQLFPEPATSIGLFPFPPPNENRTSVIGKRDCPVSVHQFSLRKGG